MRPSKEPLNKSMAILRCLKRATVPYVPQAVTIQPEKKHSKADSHFTSADLALNQFLAVSAHYLRLSAEQLTQLKNSTQPLQH